MGITKVLQEIWPKLLIFALMLMITVFQKFPDILKANEHSEDPVNQQFASGQFETSWHEYNFEFNSKSVFVIVMIGVFIFLKRRNDRAEYEAEMERRLHEDKTKYEDIDTFWTKKEELRKMIKLQMNKLKKDYEQKLEQLNKSLAQERLEHKEAIENLMLKQAEEIRQLKIDLETERLKERLKPEDQSLAEENTLLKQIIQSQKQTCSAKDLEIYKLNLRLKRLVQQSSNVQNSYTQLQTLCQEAKSSPTRRIKTFSMHVKESSTISISTPVRMLKPINKYNQ